MKGATVRSSRRVWLTGAGTLAATAVGAWLGARIFRAHDVLPTRQALDMVASIKGDRPPARLTRGLA